MKLKELVIRKFINVSEHEHNITIDVQIINTMCNFSPITLSFNNLNV